MKESEDLSGKKAVITATNEELSDIGITNLFGLTFQHGDVVDIIERSFFDDEEDYWNYNVRNQDDPNGAIMCVDEVYFKVID